MVVNRIVINMHLIPAFPIVMLITGKLEISRGAGNGPLMRSDIVSCDPDVMSGTPVFAGTRVPVQTFLDYIEGGDSIDVFLDGFPSVKREQVIAFLEEAAKRMLSTAA